VLFSRSALHLTDAVQSNQTAHGGLVLSLTDTLGSLAVATRGQWMTGVSTDIGASFVKPSGRIGDMLTAKASLVGMGK
jgi:acyl-coenzyme A thioesterase 13